MTFFDIFSKKSNSEAENHEKPKIVIDNREKNSLVPSELSRLDIDIEFQHLPIADYLIGNAIAIERKTVSDLKSSIINKRIFQQMAEIKQFPKSLLIIEGNRDELYDNHVLKANAVIGFLLSAQLEYDIPIIFSENEKETANIIYLLLKKKEKPLSLRPSKIPMTKEEQIQFILEGFPNVGPAKARNLIKKFKSLKNVFNADESELQDILGKRAKYFRDLVD